jgi:cell division protein FtsN
MEKDDQGIFKSRTLLGLGLLAMIAALLIFLGIFDLDGFLTHSDPTPTQQELPVKVPDGEWEEEDRAPQMESSPTAVADRETLASLSDIAEAETEVPQSITAAPLQSTEKLAISGPDGSARELRIPTDTSEAQVLDPRRESENETEPSLAEVESPYPYSVLLATFMSRRKAERALRIYAGQALETYYVKVNLGRKGVRYRVFAGSFKDRGEALALVRAKNLQQVATKKTSYACLIDKSSTEEALARKMESLKRLGHSPYVVNKDDGRYYLYVGAFYTEKGATSQLAELSSQRIPSQVVER